MIEGPLQGVRILDLTHVWAGPLGARFLADLGAEVVCIEPPFARGPTEFPEAPLGGFLGGEPGPEPWNNSALFNKLHRNRRSVCLDLKKPAGRALFLDLVREADAVMENFSAGTMSNLGLGFEVLSEANPDLVHLSMPGYGAEGPYSDWLAFGLTAEAMSGLTQVMGYEEGQTRNSTIALNDPMAATHAAAAVMEALLDGGGRHIELTLHEVGVSFNGPWLVAEQMGVRAEPLGNAHPNMAPHGVYRCEGEDAWLAVACSDAAMRTRLAALIGSEEDHHLDAALSAWCSMHPPELACERLQGVGVAAGPVRGAQEMLADEQAKARGFFDFSERTGEVMPGNPMLMEGLSSADWRPCPRLGEDNAAVLEEWLGISSDEVTSYMNDGVLADRPPS